MTGTIPYPDNREDVARHLKPMVRVPPEHMWIAKKIKAQSVINYVKKHGVVDPTKKYYQILNQHLFLRACNQVNEACNKIWGTCELYHHMKRGAKAMLCDKFNPGFLPSSTIPALYYADISSMLSILSFFGIGSYFLREDKPKYYDLVRTSKGFQVEERRQHVRSLTGKTSGGWHDQVAYLYEGLLKNGMKLPRINLSNFRLLKQDRFAYDYGILTKTSMAGTFGEHQYFRHLPHVLFVTQKAIRNLHAVVEHLHNKCDSRFVELASAILPLGRRYLGTFSPAYRKMKVRVKRILG